MKRNSLVQERLKKVFTFDKIRMYKLIEIIQYTFIISIITLIFAKGIEKIIDTIFPEEEIKETNKFKIFFIIFVIMTLNAMAFFYIIKIAKVIPPLPYLWDKDFLPFTSLEYVLDFSVIFILISADIKLVEYIERLFK